MIRTALARRRRHVGALALLLATGCGGGANVDVGVLPGGPDIRGTVSLPDGKLARGEAAWQRAMAAVVSVAQALRAEDVEPVGAGVDVRLVRIASGDIVNGEIRGGTTVFTSKTEANGTFRVRMPTGTNPETCRFVLEVGSAGNRTLTRAFVHADRVNIDFESEATVRLILDEIGEGNAALCDFSATEIGEIYAAVHASDHEVFGSTIAEVNAAAAAVAASDPDVQEAIAAAEGAPTPTPPATNTAPATATATAAPPTPTTRTTASPTRTNTAGPTATAPPTRTATNTVPPTATNTAVPTNTSVPATNTPLPTNTSVRTNTPTATNTPVPTDTPLPTSTPLPTNTATAIPPTATATETASHTATPTATLGPPEVNLGAAAASAGGVVSLPVTLVDNGAAVSAVSNDIEFDSRQLAVVIGANGPDCTVDARLAASKQVFARVSSLAGDRTRLRVGLVGTDNNATISSGPLYTCRFAIDIDAPSAVELLNTPEAAAPEGVPVAVVGGDGHIDVATAPASLDLSDASAAPGETATVTARLSSRGQALAAVSTDITFDPARIVPADQDGTPDCEAEPGIGDKEVVAAVLGPDQTGMSTLRVGVVGRDNNAALPDSGTPLALFSCRFVVQTAGDAIALPHEPEGASPTAELIGLRGGAGTITVP